MVFCKNCGNGINEQMEFCPNCGTRIESASEKEVPINNQKLAKNNKKFMIIIIVAIILGISIIVVSLYFLLIKKDNTKSEEKPEQNIIEETNSLSTYQKLKEDYENGIIDVNKYFTELVYYEYDSSKLDEEYKSDVIVYTGGYINELLNILDVYEEELDDKIVKEFLIKASLSDVLLTNKSILESQSNNSSNYQVQKLNDSNKENAANHYLNKVALSENNNFLIWYTDKGSDAITEDTLDIISRTLENSIIQYSKTFNIEYNYNAYVDNKYLNDDYKGAKSTLEQHDIDLNYLKTAMSVYVYDTGSDGTLATYIDETNASKIINRSLIFDIMDEDGVINYPYIRINKKAISSENDSLEQTCAHELFHHYQYLYCKMNSQSRCVAGDYIEGMANLASSLLYSGEKTNSFLNGHASVYRRETSSKLSEITDGANYGYASFPYWYAYTKVVDNWVEILMKAHTETEPYKYIMNNTLSTDLIKISETLTKALLINEPENNALFSNSDFTIEETLSEAKTVSKSINAGAIVFYEVSGNNFLEVISENSNNVGIKFYGYKDGVYTELNSSMENVKADLSYYVRYDKFYIALYNTDLVNSYSYTINIKESNYEENSDYVTTFKNYNIEIEMDITIAGINTNTISTGVVDELHQKEYLDMTTTSMGLISLNNKIYHDFNTGYSYMTQPYGGDVWWKDKSATQMVDLGLILDKLISMENVSKVEENHYKIKMTQEDVSGLMSSSNTDASVISGDIYVEVYTENGYITQLDYDFSNIIEGFDVFTTTIKYSNYDNAGDVEIPQSIIDNAQEQ